MDKQINIKLAATGGDNVLRLMAKLDETTLKVTSDAKGIGVALSDAMGRSTKSIESTVAAASKFNGMFRSGLNSIKNFSTESMTAFREMISAKNELDKVMSKSPNQFSTKKVIAELEAASRKADYTKAKFQELQQLPKGANSGAWNTAFKRSIDDYGKTSKTSKDMSAYYAALESADNKAAATIAKNQQKLLAAEDKIIQQRSKNATQKAKDESEAYRMEAARAAGIGKTNKELDTTAKYLKVIWTYYKIMAGIKLLSIGVSEIQKYADTYVDIINQTRAAIGESSDLLDINKKIYKLAQESRVDYTATAKLFNRIAMSNDTLRLSMTDVAKLTETITKSFTLAGATAGEAASATLQIGQALSKGIVNGDELRSVLENNAIIAKILSKELGVSRGQLVTMGAEGKITSEIFANALLKNASAVNDQFGEVTLTIGQAREQLSNALEQTLGLYAANSNLSKTIVGWIQNMTKFVEGGKLNTMLDVIGSITSALSSTGITVGMISRAYLSWRIGIFAAERAVKGYTIAMTALGATNNIVAASTRAVAVAIRSAKAAMLSTGVGIVAIALGELAARLFDTYSETKANNEATKELITSLSAYDKELNKTIDSTERATAALAAMSAVELRGALFKANAQLAESSQQVDELVKSVNNLDKLVAMPRNIVGDFAALTNYKRITKIIEGFDKLDTASQRAIKGIIQSGASFVDTYKQLNDVLSKLQDTNFKVGDPEERAAAWDSLKKSIEATYGVAARAEEVKSNITGMLMNKGISTTPTAAAASSYISSATETEKKEELQVRLKPVLDEIGAAAIGDDAAFKFRDSFNRTLKAAYAENINSIGLAEIITRELSNAQLDGGLKEKLSNMFASADPLQGVGMNIDSVVDKFRNMRTEAHNAATSMRNDFEAVKSTLNAMATAASSAISSIGGIGGLQSGISTALGAISQ